MSAENNREKMPNVAAVIDQFRAAGFTFRKIFAVEDLETGVSVGKFDAPGFADTGEDHDQASIELINGVGGRGEDE
jgi:hypothetical protein